MDLSPYTDGLREDLTAAASAGDEHTQRTAAVLAAAAEPSIRLTLMNALADLAAEITASLPEHVVEVRLDGRDVRVVVTDTKPEPTTDTPRPSSGAERPSQPSTEGDISRITLRLFEQIKGQAEHAAAAQGVSLNTFVAQAVQGALHGKTRSSGDESSHRAGGRSESQGDSHLHGWVHGSTPS